METRIYGNKDADIVLIQMVDKEGIQKIDEVLEHLKQLSDHENYCLLAVTVDKWNNDLSPWRAKAVFGDQDFGEGGDKTIEYLKEVLNENGFQDKKIVLGGYSLAGLFALYASYKMEVAGAMAASASLWFPRFMYFAMMHPIKTGLVYLSIGRREELTKKPVLNTVGDCIRALTEHYANQDDIEVMLEWNTGNHFKDPELRVAKGFAWMLEMLNREDGHI